MEDKSLTVLPLSSSCSGPPATTIEIHTVNLTPTSYVPHVPHDPSAGDQPPEALAVSEGVPGPDGPPGSAAGEGSGEAALALLLGLGRSLHQAGLVSEGWLNVHLVEPPGHHGEQEDHGG